MSFDRLPKTGEVWQLVKGAYIYDDDLFIIKDGRTYCEVSLATPCEYNDGPDSVSLPILYDKLDTFRFGVHDNYEGKLIRDRKQNWDFHNYDPELQRLPKKYDLFESHLSGIYLFVVRVSGDAIFAVPIEDGQLIKSYDDGSYELVSLEDAESLNGYDWFVYYVWDFLEFTLIDPKDELSVKFKDFEKKAVKNKRGWKYLYPVDEHLEYFKEYMTAVEEYSNSQEFKDSIDDF